MNAPDKIYINKYMLRRGMLYPAQKPADEPEFEYIRKDALLESLKKELELMERTRRPSQIGAAVLQKIIDKINSL